MRFKGIYKDKSSVSKVIILFFLLFISVILHTIIAVALTICLADNGMSLITNQDLTNQVSVNYLKLMQLFSGVGLFIFPTLFFAYLTDFDFKFASISRQDVILILAIMMLINPFISLLLEWNMRISLPEWLLLFDKNSEEIIKAFLKMSTIWDLLYTLIVIAVVPAIGEELLFRGYMQKKISKWLKNPQIAIVITAFLFSAIHLEAEGIIPRFALGILLGYLYYWSGNLWIPILAHFVNNAQVVIFSYHLFKIDSVLYSTVSEVTVDPLVALFSFVSVVLLLYIFHQNLGRKKDDKASFHITTKK